MRRSFDDLVAHGRTDAVPAFRKALEARPSVIVLATAKGFDLDESFVSSINELRGNSPVKVHTFAIGGQDPNHALENLARASGGEFRPISGGDLRASAQ